MKISCYWAGSVTRGVEGIVKKSYEKPALVKRGKLGAVTAVAVASPSNRI